MTGHIFNIQDDGTLVEMNEQPFDSEDKFQELLSEYPNLLAGDQIQSLSPRRWLLVKREMGVPDKEAGAERWSVDHLFLDQDAIPTLVEVKRSSDTRIRREVVGQMLDYAANAIVYWPVEKIQAEYEQNCQREGADPDERLAQFLDDDAEPEEFWQRVKTNLQAKKIRLLFVADVIPPELRRIVEFLNEVTDPVEVLAVEIRHYVGEGLKTLVPRVIGQTAVAEAKKRSGDGGRQWSDWETALSSITNPAVLSYFKQEVAANREAYLRRRSLRYRIAGKRRWFVAARKEKAYVWQNGRFDDDIGFWQDKLSQPDDVKPVKSGECLRFFLHTDDDFKAFGEAATEGLESTEWLGGSPDEEMEEVEAENDQ